MASGQHAAGEDDAEVGAAVAIDVALGEAGADAELARGAAEHQPITARGDSGFVTASVVDPFSNILGVMSNPHYLEVLAGTIKA